MVEFISKLYYTLLSYSSTALNGFHLQKYLTFHSVYLVKSWTDLEKMKRFNSSPLHSSNHISSISQKGPYWTL